MVDRKTFDWTISSYQDAVDYIVDVVGDDFRKMIALANEVTDRPDSFTGVQANIASIKLAGYRANIGLAAQYFKQKSTQSKSPHDRLIKDALMVMYDSLLELINTLKLRSRYDKDMIGATPNSGFMGEHYEYS